MRVLVVGANGLLGSNVVSLGLAAGQTIAGTYHTTEPDLPVPLWQLDVREHGTFDRIVSRMDPDVVVNCAAMTDVDDAETDPDRARTINALAPGELARLCSESNRRFVHVSTDYVFDGTAGDPYPESAPTNPVQVYGETKREGEQRVREAQPEAVVARLSFVYGIHRGLNELQGFPAWITDRLRRGDQTPLFVDQWVSPSRAGAAAEALLELASSEGAGIFHVACRSCVTPYEFGRALCERMGENESLLTEGRRSAVDRPAVRPAYTCLDVSKLEARLDRHQPTLAADLSAIAAAFSSHE